MKDNNKRTRMVVRDTVCKMSGWGRCEDGFTLQQDPCCSGMCLWILTNTFIFFFSFVSNTSYFCPSSCSLSTTLHPSRTILPYWLCEVHSPARRTGTGKGVGSIPGKLQVFIGLSVWDNLSAGLHHRLNWYILFCNWCPCCQTSLQDGGSRQNPQDAPRFHWCRWKRPKTACLHDRSVPSISLLEVKIVS